MFVSVIEGKEYGWKPMNCPGAMLIFGSRARSYRELPLRLAEFAPLHRYEASGTLHGLMRVRELVQDDAHIFLTEEQIEPEIRVLLEWVKEACATFRLSWSAELSTRPVTFLGEAADWDRAEAVLGNVLRSAGVEFRASAGEGAFYAPKIDIHLKDSLGRPWQTGTIQLDYQMPRRFHLEYQGADGRLHTPIVVHRTILGTWERFVGVLTEHVAGRWPPWLAPVQVPWYCPSPTPTPRLPAARRTNFGRRGYASTWPPATNRFPSAFVRRSSTGSRTSWCSGTERSRTVPSRCASAGRRPPARCPARSSSPMSWTASGGATSIRRARASPDRQGYYGAPFPGTCPSPSTSPRRRARHHPLRR